MCACTFCPCCTPCLPCGTGPCSYYCCPPQQCYQPPCPPPVPCTPCPPCNCCARYRPSPPPVYPDIVPPIVPMLPRCKPRRSPPAEPPPYSPPTPVFYPPVLPCCPPCEPCGPPPVQTSPEPIRCYQPVLPCFNRHCPPPILPRQRPICPRAPPCPYPCLGVDRSSCPVIGGLDPVTRRRPLITYNCVMERKVDTGREIPKNSDLPFVTDVIRLHGDFLQQYKRDRESAQATKTDTSAIQYRYLQATKTDPRARYKRDTVSVEATMTDPVPDTSAIKYRHRRLRQTISLQKVVWYLPTSLHSLNVDCDRIGSETSIWDVYGEGGKLNLERSEGF